MLVRNHRSLTPRQPSRLAISAGGVITTRKQSEKIRPVMPFQSTQVPMLSANERAAIHRCGWGVKHLDLPQTLLIWNRLVSLVVRKLGNMHAYRQATFRMLVGKRTEVAGLAGGIAERVRQMEDNLSGLNRQLRACLDVGERGMSAAQELGKRIQQQMGHIDRAKKMLEILRVQGEGYRNLLHALPAIEAARADAQAEVDVVRASVEMKETLAVDFTSDDPMQMIQNATGLIEEKKARALAALAARGEMAGASLESGLETRGVTALPDGVSTRGTSPAALEMTAEALRALSDSVSARERGGLALGDGTTQAQQPVSE